MKLRSMVLAMTAAAIGVGAPAFAQAAHADGYSRADSQYSGGYGDRHHHDHGGGSDGLAIAVGMGILGVILASEMNDRPPQQYGYAPPNQYGYAPPNQYGYAQPNQYGYAPAEQYGYPPAYGQAPQYGYTPACPPANYGPGYGYQSRPSPYGY